MLFDLDECTIIISALETYDEKARGELPPSIQHSVVSSALKKLEVLSSLTHFTKQEFAVMALAVRFISKLFKVAPESKNSLHLALFDKLIKLAS